MSEIPKLIKEDLYDLYNCVEKEQDKNMCPLYISLDNLKEVNAFYDKYKDDENSFWADYNVIWKIYAKVRDKVNFKDWLHDYLYKVE